MFDGNSENRRIAEQRSRQYAISWAWTIPHLMNFAVVAAASIIYYHLNGPKPPGAFWAFTSGFYDDFIAIWQSGHDPCPDCHWAYGFYYMSLIASSAITILTGTILAFRRDRADNVKLKVYAALGLIIVTIYVLMGAPFKYSHETAILLKDAPTLAIVALGLPSLMVCLFV
jgi:hypothetical protein